MDTAERLASGTPEVARIARSSAPVDLAFYARDLWPRRLLDLRAGIVAEHRPGVIVWPTTTDDVAAIVRFAAHERIPVVPFGAGSGVCGGITPDPEAIIIDLKRMKQVRALDESAPSIEVEAGALGITLEEDLGRRGYTLGHFPSSILCSTVGGWLAARSAGQCSGRYGKIEDMAISLECVLGSGEVVTLRRRASGLDLTPLFIGSEGTMGVITAAALRLHAAPAARAFSSFSFGLIEEGWNAMREMFQRGLRPAVARLYDPLDSFLAKMGSVRSKAGAQKKVPHAPGGGSRVLPRLLQSPPSVRALFGRVADRTLGGSTLVLIFEGTPEEAAADASAAFDICSRLGGRTLGEGPARRWLSHRYSVSYRQAPLFRSGAFSDTFEVAAPWSRLEALYHGVRAALSRHVLVLAHLSHAYPDGCSVYFTFAGAGRDAASSAAVYDEAWRVALEAAIAAGGTISHHHGVGRSKAPRMGAELGRGVDVVRALLVGADPAGIMNPGNLLPAAGEADGPGREAASPPSTDAARTLPVTSVLDRLVLDATSLLLTAPAGAPLGDVEAWLGVRGLTLALQIEADRTLALGQWLAAGAPGAPDRWEDPVDHLVAGLCAKLPSGLPITIRPSPRRAVGPDLTALWVGSGQRFGEITEVTLRVHRTRATRARRLTTKIVRSPPVSPSEERLAESFALQVRAIGSPRSRDDSRNGR